MMVNMIQIKTGVKKYIANDMLSQITDWRRWVIGAFADPFLDKIDPIINEASTRNMLVSVGVIHEENEHIDLDRLREMFLAQAREHGRVSINIPLAGAYFIGEQDIQKIYEYIVTS